MRVDVYGPVYGHVECRVTSLRAATSTWKESTGLNWIKCVHWSTLGIFDQFNILLYHRLFDYTVCQYLHVIYNFRLIDSQMQATRNISDLEQYQISANNVRDFILVKYIIWSETINYFYLILICKMFCEGVENKLFAITNENRGENKLEMKFACWKTCIFFI